MRIDLSPEVAAILKMQVAEGLFDSVEQAVAAAILGGPLIEPKDLSWAAPYLAEADDDIEHGRTVSQDEAFARLMDHVGRE